MSRVNYMFGINFLRSKCHKDCDSTALSLRLNMYLPIHGNNNNNGCAEKKKKYNKPICYSVFF